MKSKNAKKKRNLDSTINLNFVLIWSQKHVKKHAHNLVAIKKSKKYHQKLKLLKNDYFCSMLVLSLSS